MYSQSLLEPVAMCYHLCITDKSNVLAESSSVFLTFLLICAALTLFLL